MVSSQASISRMDPCTDQEYKRNKRGNQSAMMTFQAASKGEQNDVIQSIDSSFLSEHMMNGIINEI